ncbi:hypothetical protein [Geobacter sp.]|uniref:hypothetical protein n=1 Tax=Geobacter sp. TaxID=46610 RepID=UPI0027B894F3|nr:hypothetical protein [Geobacter sp.]
MRQFEWVLTAITWYQTETHFDPLTCKNDGTKLIGCNHLGHVYLECPLCGLRRYDIPPYVIELYFKENDIPTMWQIHEATALAEKLGRTVPDSVLVSAVQLEQYIKATKGKVIALGEWNGQSS